MKHPQNRAERRHKQFLADTRARVYRKRLMGTTDGWYRHRHQRTLCSCWMCGNPRTHHDELTIQEHRAAYLITDYLQESSYD